MSEPYKSALAIIAGILAAGLTPAAPIAPSAWAAKNLIVADGPRRGSSFDPMLTPYLIEPLDFISEDVPGNKGVFRKSKQIGATTMAIAAVGYSAAVEPCDMMLIEPTEDSLSDFLALKLQPAIENSSTLGDPKTGAILPQTARSSRGSTASIKRFRGGGSLLAGIATSSAFLRGKTRQKVIRDEASEYEHDLAGQGSPHDMIGGAYMTFLASGEWKDLWISTPTIAGACHITKEFEGGDRRFWHVRCPGCGEEFVFSSGKNFVFKDEYPHEAHYVAPCCGTVIEHHQKNELVRKGRWIATAPGPGKFKSWHFDTLSSPFVTWDHFAAEAVRARDDAGAAKGFDTLWRGVAHEVRGDAPDHARLMALREPYDRGRIPPHGLVFVGSADVQANAIYVEVAAFAPDRQSWVVEAMVLDGDTSDPERGAFARLTQVFETEWPDSYGGRRRVDAFGVDSGFRSHVVYSWVRGRPNAFALKGGDGWSRPAFGIGQLQDIDLGGRRIRQGVALHTIGTWSLKAQLYADLRKRRLSEGAEIEPAGALHFGTWMDEVYFVQLTNEYLQDEPFKGRSRRVWKERGPNHFLDCRVYNMALADYLGLSRMTQDEWARLARERAAPMLNDGSLFAPRPLQVQVEAAAVDAGADRTDADAERSETVAVEQPSAPRAGWITRRANWLKRS